jgi:hypothetical protein
MQRFLPFIAIFFLIAIVLPQLLGKKHSSSLSAKTKAAQTLEGMTLIRNGEKAYFAAHSRFTSHLADLAAQKPRLTTDLATPLDVHLDVGTDGKSYVAQVSSDYLSLVRTQSGSRLVSRTCLVVKSGSGVKCPSFGTKGKG